jgi:hypothetical protein
MSEGKQAVVQDKKKISMKEWFGKPLVKKVVLPVAGLIVLLLAVTLFVSFRVPAYNQAELDKVTALEADSVALVKKGTEPYAEHSSDIAKVNKEFEAAEQFAQKQPDSQMLVKQFEIMNDPNGALLGKALADWQKKGTLTEGYILATAPNIEDGYGEIIKLVKFYIQRNNKAQTGKQGVK